MNRSDSINTARRRALLAAGAAEWRQNIATERERSLQVVRASGAKAE